MKKYNFFAILLFLAILMILPASTVFACSGYPHFGASDLPRMDLLVKATVIKADDRGHNAILRIEEYYKGEGRQFLMVNRYSPALQSAAYVRGYDTGCLYAGRGHRWIEGDQGYFGLNPNSDGTFTDNNGGTAHFYPVDGQITFQEGFTEGYALEFDDPHVLSEEEFVSLLLEIGERDEPLIPDDPTDLYFMPLMRYLNITTENGTRYRINPDRSITELSEDSAIAISPDGAHLAMAIDEASLSFNYLWASSSEESQSSIKGQAVEFSSDSNFAAVWDKEHIAIYMFNNQSYSGYGLNMGLSEVSSLVFAEEQEKLPTLMWSADATTLVWQTDTAVWHWNIYDAAEPTQLITLAKMTDFALPETALLDISTYGRYVRVGASSEWLLLDSETLETSLNQLASPDEKYLIYKSNVLPHVENNTRCTPPLNDTCSLGLGFYEEELVSVFPYQHYLLGVVTCDEEQTCTIRTQSWQPAIGTTQYYSALHLQVSDIRQVVYDIQYDIPAIVVGDYGIYLNFYSDGTVSREEYQPYLDILNLEDELDSPIASVEWGQPLFYDIENLRNKEEIPR